MGRTPKRERLATCTQMLVDCLNQSMFTVLDVGVKQEQDMGSSWLVLPKAYKAAGQIPLASPNISVHTPVNVLSTQHANHSCHYVK